MNQEQIDWTLIRKQIDGCLTDEERECLERWMAGDERRRGFVEHACLYYKRNLPVVDETRISEAWQHFGKRNGVNVYSRYARGVRRLWLFWLLVLGCGYWAVVKFQ